MCPRKPDREAIVMLQELQHLHAREPLLDIEPPALIDQAVRNMARRERTSGSSPTAGNLPWIAGLFTVSIALIAVGISMVQTPPGPGPVNESFESEKTELRNSREQSDLAQPAAPSWSRSAPAPAAEATMTVGEAQQMEMDAASNSAGAELQLDSPTKKNGLAKESAVADHDSSQVAGLSESSESPSVKSREESADAWLDLIEQLHEQGLRNETLEQLRAWQTQYPDLPLPDWATTLLQAQP